MRPSAESLLVTYRQLQTRAKVEDDDHGHDHLKLEQAKVAVNWVADHAEEDPDTGLALCADVRRLASAGSTAALREQQAKIITNWIADCAAARPETARALYGELVSLATAFGIEIELTVQRAKAAGNLAFAAGERQDLDLGTFAFRELSRIVDDHADKLEIKAVVEHVTRMFGVEDGQPPAAG